MHIFRWTIVCYVLRIIQTPYTPNKSNMFAFATMRTIERVSILESFNIMYQQKKATVNKLKKKGNDKK